MRELIAFYHHNKFPCHFTSPTSTETVVNSENAQADTGGDQHSSMTDYEELEFLLSAARQSDQFFFSKESEPLSACNEDSMALLTIGKNRYKERIDLDDSFTRNYELWIQQEIIGFGKNSGDANDTDEDDFGEDDVGEEAAAGDLFLSNLSALNSI